MNFPRPRAPWLAVALATLAAPILATSVIPITDQELYRRADVVVHGIVTSSDVTVDAEGRPETLSFIEPISVLKGRLAGPLVLHQIGGTLPDGRFLKIWGRPEYVPGREVVVFATAHASGEFTTAEMLLGKFDVEQDSAGTKFAVADLTAGLSEGVSVVHLRQKDAMAKAEESSKELRDNDSESGPRPLASFLAQVRAGRLTAVAGPTSSGNLTPVTHPSKGRTPEWANWATSTFYRWNNNATATWTTLNTANITGGGAAEALGAAAAWTNDPTSNINYTIGSGSSNTIDLNAMAVCGTSGCLAGGGVIGCGGPSGLSGSNTWRGDTYTTINGGFMQLRAYCTFNLYDSITTQAVIEHELGHTLGFGHSDQLANPNDTCRGDEDAAIMRSVVQHRISLGTDDRDAIRWTYGDGGKSCGGPTVSGVGPTFGSVSGGTVVTIIGSNFVAGATVTVGGVAATGVTVLDPQTIRAITGAHAAGAVTVVVTNPDTQTGSLANAFTYATGSRFFTITPCRVLDTRNAAGALGGPALVAGAERAFVLAGQCGIPATAKSLSANIAVTQSSTAGFVTIFQGGLSAPITSTINYSSGQTRANDVMIPLGLGGDMRAKCGQITGTVHLIVDVNGYFQ